jgi:hypothetical protein
MDRYLLYHGVTKASESMNSTIINKLKYTDVFNTFKVNVMLSRYFPSIHTLINIFFQQILVFICDV